MRVLTSPRNTVPDRLPASAGVSSQQLFPRAHKSALGFAFGALAGSVIFVITVIHVITKVDGLPLYLLKQYFAGYSVTWPGAFIGLVWGFAIGFIGGWLLGFVHNFTVGLWLFIV